MAPRKAGLAHAEAEDAVQSTIISVCKSIKQFEADPARGSFKAWLLQQTRWRIADQWRKRPPEERARAHRPANKRSDTSGTPTEERIPDNNRDPLEQAWDEDWRMTLTAAALELVKRQVSARDLQIFVMLTFQGAAPDAVAQLNELERNNVDQIKYRVGKLFEKAAEDLKRRWE